MAVSMTELPTLNFKIPVDLLKMLVDIPTLFRKPGIMGKTLLPF